MKSHEKPPTTCFRKKILYVFYFSLIFIMGVSNPAAAQKAEKIKELMKEFFMGERVNTQEKNEMQFNLMPAFWKNEEMGTTGIPLTIEYGFTSRFQAELMLPYYILHPKGGKQINGIGNTEVALKYNILRGSKPFALSVGLGVSFPTANKEKEIAEPETEWEPSLIVAKQIGRGQVHGGLGAEITKDESVIHYNLAAVYPFGDWRTILELNGTFNREKTIYITPGFVWKGLDDFELGAAISKSITKNTAEWGVLLMLTYEFSLK